MHRPHLATAIARAREWSDPCRLCPRRCGAQRLRGELGFCRAPYPARVFYHNRLYGEEVELCPSYEVFFTGCNLRCVFCYAWEWLSGDAPGEAESVVRLADGLGRAVRGCRSMSLIGGEPTVNLLSALELLASLPQDAQVVWNTNLYMDPGIPGWLSGVVDLYVGDLHYFHPACATALGGPADYFEQAARALLAAREAGAVLGRWLLVPGHLECCFRETVRWLGRHAPEVTVRILGNYCSRRGETLDPADFRAAEAFAGAAGLRLYRPAPAAAGPGPPAFGDRASPPSETLYIDPDGRVLIPHLTRELLEVAAALAPGDPDLAGRLNLRGKD